MWLRACLNGSRLVESHPALPITPQELAQQGRSAIEAGAVALHIHPRALDGRETLEAERMASTLLALRDACPGIPIEVSTAAWIEKDADQRLVYVQQWYEFPDSAGVNFGEVGAVELAKTLLAKGVGVEAGLFTAADAQCLIDAGLAPHCNHVQIEPILALNVVDALATAQEIERLLNNAGVTTPRLLHGKDATAWPLLAYAIGRGYATRIGLEDTLLLPNGKTAHDNAELVRTAWLYNEAKADSRFKIPDSLSSPLRYASRQTIWLGILLVSAFLSLCEINIHKESTIRWIADSL